MGKKMDFSIKSERYERKLERARAVYERSFWDAIGCGESEAGADAFAKRASDRVMAL